MAKVRPESAPFKDYRQLAIRLRRDGRLVLPRPERCGVCRGDCGFVKDGHYFRDFVFRQTVISHVGVQRYLCKDLEGGTFCALAAFQEPRARYTVELRGAVLQRVFVDGKSKRSAWRQVRRTPGGSSLARSTVTDWCRRFDRLAAGHAAALAAYLGQRLPGFEPRVRGDPALLLGAARAIFGLQRSLRSERFWEWLHEILLRAADRRLLSA